MREWYGRTQKSEEEGRRRRRRAITRAIKKDEVTTKDREKKRGRREEGGDKRRKQWCDQWVLPTLGISWWGESAKWCELWSPFRLTPTSPPSPPPLSSSFHHTIVFTFHGSVPAHTRRWPSPNPPFYLLADPSIYTCIQIHPKESSSL